MDSVLVARQDYVTVYLDSDIKRKFKSQCALDGVEMSTIAAKLIESWLSEREGKLGVGDRTNGKKP